jgi:hypothetical protein
MSDIDNLLAQQGDAELKVFVREIPEVFDPSSQKEAQTSRISLYLSFKGREEPEEIYLGRVIPEKRNLFRIGCRSPDLDYFTEDEHISLQRGLETDILTTLVLKYMVRIDPRIRGNNSATPKANLTMVGNRPYDPEEMQEIYQRVQESRKQRSREGGKLHDFLSFTGLVLDF